MTKLKWNFKELPSGGDVAKLVEQGIITKQEAREMVVRENKEIKVETNELDEIKTQLAALTDLVNELAKKQPTINYWPIIERYRYVETWPVRPYWYASMCSNANNRGLTSTTADYKVTN